MTNAELQQLLQGAGQFGLNRFGGPSFVDQYRNGNAQMSALKKLNIGTDITQNQFDSAKSAINSGKASAVAGGAVAALQGITSILGNTFNMAQISDTSQYENQIDEIGEIGNTGYSTFEQLNQDYDRLAGSPMRIDKRDIRGKTDGELAGGVLSSTLSGAATGLTVGGPWGALAGGVIGAGAGIAGVITGNKNADIRKGMLEQEASANAYEAQRNLSLANENLMDYNFRSGVSRRAAMGGKIVRNEMGIQEFADRVMKRSRGNDTTRSAGVIRRHEKGGTVVRIKR